MAHVVRGALIEYGSDFLGPLPNVVVFQFNFEQLERRFEIQQRATDERAAPRQREPNSTAAPPVETFSLKLQFSAADDFNKDDPIAKLFGIGPQLAALEKMAFPSQGLLSGAIGAAIDAVGDLLGGGGAATRPVPRESLPRILFVGGFSRVLPVEIRSISITEQQFNHQLVPIRAEVDIGLAVASFPKDSTDLIGQGALTYTQTVKDAQAVINLGKALQLAADVIPF